MYTVDFNGKKCVRFTIDYQRTVAKLHETKYEFIVSGLEDKNFTRMLQDGSLCFTETSRDFPNFQAKIYFSRGLYSVV